MNKTLKQAENNGIKVVFRLEAQGHIPIIQETIKQYSDSFKNHYPDAEYFDMSYEKHVWERIGKLIGWCPFTACLSYFKWLSKNKQKP